MKEKKKNNFGGFNFKGSDEWNKKLGRVVEEESLCLCDEKEERKKVRV